MECLTTEQAKKINKQSLADKYNCTRAYVGLVLSGQRAANTEMARAILTDAHAIIKVLEGINPEKEQTHV